MSESITTTPPDLWTIEQVKEWAESSFPFGRALATALAENDIDGPILLDHITDDTLKQDLGVKSLGQRVKILQAVAALKFREGKLVLCVT